MAHNIFDEHDSAFHHHTEIQCAQGQQVCRNVAEFQTGGGKQQRKRNGDGHDDCSSNISEEQEQNDRYQNHPFGKVMEHGMRGVMHQVTAVEKGDDLHAGGQNVVVQFLHFFVDALQGGIGRRAFAQEHDSGDNVIVVDDLSIFAVNGARELAETNFWTL